MKETSELNNLMLELLESNIDPKTMEITDRGREIIDEISDYAEQTPLFQEHKVQGTMFDDSTLKQVYGYMLNRIVNAPTEFHKNASIILIMPFVRQKLREESNNE